MSTGEARRGFVLVGAFFVFGAIMAAYAAATLLKPGTALDRLWVLNQPGHDQLVSLGKVGGWGFVVLSGLLCATSLGWFRRRAWGWVMGVMIVAINAAGDLVNVAFGEHLKGAIGLGVAGLLLWYITGRSVKSCFNAALK
jgi:hypothetical protein